MATKKSPSEKPTPVKKTVAGKSNAKATSETTKEVTEETVDVKIDKKATAPGDREKAMPLEEDPKNKEKDSNEDLPDGTKEGQEAKGPATSEDDLDLSKIESKKDLKDLNADEIKEIEEKYLKDFEIEVDKIEIQEDLEELREAEAKGSDRKGAYAIIDRKSKELKSGKSNDSEDSGNQVGKLKKLRVRTDKVLSFYQDHMNINSDQSGSDRLFLAKCWMGKMLAELDTKNPYDTGKKLTKPTDIPPTADVAEGDEFHRQRRDFKNLNDVEALDTLRTEIEKLCKELVKFKTSSASREMNIARTNAYGYLCEAKFFMGKQLSQKRR